MEGGVGAGIVGVMMTGTTGTVPVAVSMYFTFIVYLIFHLLVSVGSIDQHFPSIYILKNKEVNELFTIPL